MAEAQIKYAIKYGGTTHEHIVELGNENGMLPVSVVVSNIEQGIESYFTYEGGKRAEIRVRQGPSGRKFVQTVADGCWSNNLLSLPPSPRKSSAAE